MKARYLVLTDINLNKMNPIAEVDDVQSLVRLLLYSNEIDIEGIIACTSCFLKKGAGEKNVNVIRRVIDGYEKVKANLDVHASGYPAAAYLQSVVCAGIPAFGKAVGDGFAEEQYRNNAGVKQIIQAIQKEDGRSLWIGLWGGSNTLAQAIWQMEQDMPSSDFERALRKLRIYGISDQDYSSHWLREKYGDKLFYIVTPSIGENTGSKDYYQATWPGISSDKFGHGSEDGIQNGGFTGARFDMIDKRWIRKHIRSRGSYGKLYPLPVFITEGDSPSYMGLIANGLNEPEKPDYGGWGGRYQFYLPEKDQFPVAERYPIWTNSSDTVLGTDGKLHCSPQATIWRWREDFQNDFEARMIWSTTSEYKGANHAPVIKLAQPKELVCKPGDAVSLDASMSMDPDGDTLRFQWIYYKEAGTCPFDLLLSGADSGKVSFTAPALTSGCSGMTIHMILAVSDTGTPRMTSYARTIITVADGK